VPFHDDATCLRWHRFIKPPDRRRRLRLFAETYGLASVEGLVDRVIRVNMSILRSFGALLTVGTDGRSTWSPADTSSSCRSGCNGQWRTVT
jgi:hypothetical protein